MSSMTHELETVAWVNDAAGMARMIPVTVSYELEGYKPLGLWIYDKDGTDRTMDMTQDEYDILYLKVCDNAADNIRAALEVAKEWGR